MSTDDDDDTIDLPADAATPPEARGEGAGGRSRLARGVAVIRGKVRNRPNAPGCYRMLNAKGDVLYVGKAKNISKRVASYTRGHGHTNRISRMIAQTVSM